MRGICGMRQSCLSNSSFVFSLHPSKNAVTSRCSFRVTRAVAEHTMARKPKASSNDYVIPVISFLRRHLAANAGKYPKLSLVMQETGCSQYMVRKILNEIKSGKLDIGGSDVTANCQELNAGKVLFNEFASLDGNGKELEHSDLPICSKKGRSDQEDAHFAVCNVDKNSASNNMPDPICKEHENMGILVSSEVEKMNKEDVHTGVKEVEQTHAPDHNPSSHAEDTREDVHVKCSLQNTGNRLLTDDTSAELEAVPLQLQPQYQKSAGSRRVNLSTVMGLENDLSWKETLSSISPDPKARQCVINAEKLNPPFQYCMSLTSTDMKSVLKNMSKASVRESFQKCGDILRIYFSRTNSSSQVFVYFKTEQGLREALKAKPAFFKGENIKVECVSPAGKEETKQMFDGVVQALTGVSSCAPTWKRMSTKATNFTAEERGDMFSSILSTLGSTESTLLHDFNRVQRTVSIENWPTTMSLRTLKDFFSQYGEVLNCFSAAHQAGEETCYIEFKNEEAKNKALELPVFTLHGYTFKYRNDEFPGTLVVRIENVNLKTSTEEVMKICQNYEVQNVIERSANVMDVQFGSGEKEKIREIVSRLEVTTDTQKWQAKLLCHGFRRFVDLPQTCQVCLQRQQDNLKLLSLTKQLLVHLEDMCARDRAI